MSWDASVLKSQRKKRNAAIDSVLKKSKPQQDEKEMPTEPTESLHERCRNAALGSEPKEQMKVDPKIERAWFLKRGAVVVCSVDERDKIKPSGKHSFYSDGRPISMCRISLCFNHHASGKKQFLCGRHYSMVEAVLRDGQLCLQADSGGIATDENKEKSGGDAGEWETVYACSYCNKQYDSYDEAASHEKDCESVTVEEATRVKVEGEPQLNIIVRISFFIS